MLLIDFLLELAGGTQSTHVAPKEVEETPKDVSKPAVEPVNSAPSIAKPESKNEETEKKDSDGEESRKKDKSGMEGKAGETELYEVLGVEKTAQLGEIKKAYFRMVYIYI